MERKTDRAIAEELDDILLLHNSLICEGQNEIFFPKILNINVPYAIMPCDSSSQSENFAKYMVDEYMKKKPNIPKNVANKLRDPINFMKKTARHKITDIQISNIYNSTIYTEKAMSKDYFVVYHATTSASLLLSVISTLLYNIEKKRNMSTILLRANKEVFKYGDKYMNNADDISDYLEYHLKNTVENITFKDRASGTDVQITNQDLINDSNNTYQKKCAADWFSYYKKIALSVNLTLFGGNFREGENTFSYFAQIQNSHTSPDFLLNLCVQAIKGHFDSYPIPQIYRSAFNDKCEQVIKILYDKLLNNGENKAFENPAVLLQIFVKKELVDKTIKISTPCGNLLNIPTKEVLDAIQKNKLDEILDYIKEAGDKIALIPSLKNNTVERVKKIKAENSIVNVQGRFIGADIDTLNEEGNMIVNVINFNGTNHTTMLHYVHKAIYALEYEANKLLNISQGSNVGSCSIM